MFNYFTNTLNIIIFGVAMIFNTTHTNKKTDAIINDLIGKPYSFFKAIKLGGIGSKRMVIEEVSPGFKKFMNSISDDNYASLELREAGIIVHINKGLQNYSWAIPFYKLHTYKTSGLSIHANGNFIRFKNNKLLQENKAFIEKIINLKIENDKLYDFYEPIT